jgi:hypothetical protein
MSRGVIAIIVVFVALIASATRPTHGQAQTRSKKSTIRTSPTPAVRTEPLTLDEVLEILKKEGSGTLPPKTAEEAVRKLKTAFFRSPDAEERLRQAGASDSLITEIPVPPAPPKPPPPPPPKSAGPLTIQCAPAECDIYLDQRFSGTTHDGIIAWNEIPARSLQVDVRKDGYELETRRIVPQEERPQKLEFVLRMTATETRHRGAETLLGAIAALGGPDAFAEASSLMIEGTVVLGDAPTKKAEWTLGGRVRLPDLASLKLKNNAGDSCELRAGAGGVKTTCKGKGNKSENEVQAAAIWAVFRDAQPSRLFGAMITAKTRITDARDGRTQGETVISVDSPDRLYEVTIGPDLLPKWITVRPSNSQSTESDQVTYSNYRLLGRSQYPMNISSGAGTGRAPKVDFRFTSVKTGAILGSKDF